MKSKGDRERYIQLKAEFQRLAWRYKKAFFNEQCINPEGNNRRENQSSLQEIGNIKGTFCSKMGTIKDRNGSDLEDTEEIKKKWKELYKKDFNEPDYYGGVVSHSDILK